MKVAVTGATGVVGRSLMRHLVEAGHDVLALARSRAGEEVVTGLGARSTPGDILDPPSLSRLVRGVDWVFHVAGVNEMCSLDPGHMDRVNIDGTRNVLDACRRGGVDRLIHTSSAVTIGQAHGEVGTEAVRHRGRYLSRYERSKHLSELVVLEAAKDLEVVVVNPSSVQGPGRATGTGKIILDVLNRKLPYLVETTVSIVDIDDCSRGHVLAAEHGVRGERYLLSGASLGMTEILGLLSELTGRGLRPRFLPGWVASAGGTLVEYGARIAGRRPIVCREMVRVMRASHVYDGSRATRDLGLVYTPIETTIRRTVDWFGEQGLLT